jgi:outer membrane lipoprotein-sorting protein
LTIDIAVFDLTVQDKLNMKLLSTKIRKNHLRAGSSLLFMLSVNLLFVTHKACQALATESISWSSNLPAGHADGKPVLERSIEASRQLRDYTVNSDLSTYRKGKAKPSSALLNFKKANLIRVQVTGSGSQAGSIVVRRADGVIRGKGGNALSFLTMTLDPDSRLLMTPNDLNVTKTDFVTLLSEARTKSSSDRCRTGAKPIYSTDLKEKVLIVDLLEPNKSNELSQRIFLRVDNHLPVAWEIYKDGKLFSRAKFLNLKINQGLADSLFQM